MKHFVERFAQSGLRDQSSIRHLAKQIETILNAWGYKFRKIRWDKKSIVIDAEINVLDYRNEFCTLTHSVYYDIAKNDWNKSLSSDALLRLILIHERYKNV